MYYDYVNCLADEFKKLKKLPIIYNNNYFNSALSAIIAKIASTIGQCK